jgi:hypothetical protein
MKRNILLIFILTLLVSCVPPRLILQDGKSYIVSEWEGGEFKYVTYAWKGGNFDDAVFILKQFGENVKTRNNNEITLGIFPDFKIWYLGMISKSPLEFDSISGNKIGTKNIPAGIYATMKLKGHPENMFTQYDKFKKLLIKDGFKVESSVYEIYSYDTFNNISIPIQDRIGEIRYKVSK